MNYEDWMISLAKRVQDMPLIRDQKTKGSLKRMTDVAEDGSIYNNFSILHQNV